MSAEYSGLIALRDTLAALRDDMPAIMEQLIMGEGVYAVKQAVNLCEEKQIDNTSLYKRSFHADEKANTNGGRYWVRFYNNADYAKHLEYGFRSHFVPGHWEGSTFVYNPGDAEGGMYVGPRGGYVQGQFVHRLATQRTADTMDSRVKRKVEAIIRSYMKKGGVS